MRAFFNAWVVCGILLFYFGPVAWDGADEPWVAIITLSSLAGFNLGVVIAGERGSPSGPSFLEPRSRTLALLAVSMHATLAIILLGTATGRSVLSGSSYQLDLGQAYDSYAQVSQQVVLSPAQQGLVFLKALVFPFALVGFVRHFRTDALISVLFLAPMGLSSLLRGTDKEVADLLLILGVMGALHGLINWRRVLIGIAAVGGALYLFLMRRLARYGDDLPTCLPESAICFDYHSTVAERFGRQAEVFSVFVSSYITNGYQGLTLAVSLPWQPNWGVGHLPSLKSALCAVSQPICGMPDYQQSLTSTGWDARARWTSVHTVLANDFSFWLVPLYFILIGVVFQCSLTTWRRFSDPTAGATLIVVAMFFVYSSANMQIAITLDWALASILLLYVTPWRIVGLRRTDAGCSQ